MEYNKQQKKVCADYNTPFVEEHSFLKVGISLNVRDEIYPINRVRYDLEMNTSGWYIWAWECSDGANFFMPLHIEHLPE